VNLIRWFSHPNIPSTINRNNFIRVQIDAIGVGLAGAASPFLPVFLSRLGASTFEISLLTTMPAVTGLLLSIPAGRFLQSRKQIVPWFSAARLLVVLSYLLTGLVPFIFGKHLTITSILVIWAIATLPQTVVSICFSVVMNAVAGPSSRFELMTRRWSILGFTTAVTVIAVGQVLEALNFPINYQIVFMALSVGGFISYYFSSRIELPDAIQPPSASSRSIVENLREVASLVRGTPAFTSFVGKRFVYLFGVALSAPIFPLYYVREVEASDSAISFINTAISAVLIVGYFIWSRASRRRGSRWVLLATTLVMAAYPALVASTRQVWIIVILSGIAGLFQAGIDLVFFDELMKTVPVEYSATFVSVAQSLQYGSAIIAPLIGSFLADAIGLGGALLVSAVIRFIGFALFAMGKPVAEEAIA
jgi:MFS family permease